MKDRSSADRLDFAPPPAEPANRLELIHRPELVTRLRDAREYPLVLITAPPGYAKTSLLAEWATEDDRDFAWLTLDARCDQPSNLLNRMFNALDTVSSGDRPFVLVIDDGHVLRSKGALDALTSTIEALPSKGQIAIASRKRLALGLGRMRAHRRVFELERRHLAMTRAESAVLLGAIGLELDSEEIDRVFEITEGWPAALYLAGLALGDDAAGNVDVAGFGGDDRFVADYIRDEFLAGISVARLRFLLRSSVLEDLNGQACDTVLDRSGSARVLKELSRGKLPLEPLGHSEASYRYHPLFRQMLRAELHRREPELETELHQRASVWYEDHERSDEAIDHAIAAGDGKRVGDLIWTRGTEHLAEGERDELRRWLDGFSNRKTAKSAQLMLASAHLWFMLGDCDQGGYWASLADEAFGGASDSDPELLADLLILKVILPSEGIAQMERDAARAAQLHPPASVWHAVACFYAGIAAHLLGDQEKARALFEESARRGAVTGPVPQVFSLTQLTFLHLDAGDSDSARRVAAHARERLERFALGECPCMAFSYVASALVRARQGLMREAAADRRRALELLRQSKGFPDWYLAEVKILLARVDLALDSPDQALQLLNQATEHAERVPEATTLQRWLAETQAQASEVQPERRGSQLTAAELRTLQFLPSHLSFKQIADRNYVSANTVKTQAQAIYRKLGAKSRAEAIEKALQLGLLGDARVAGG